jgi:hypothetical protein
MARPRILDKNIMTKIGKKLGKGDLYSVNNIVSKKASKLGISAEAALILLAKELGIGTATYQRNLDPTKQAEVRGALPSIFVADGKSAIAGAQKTSRNGASPKTSKRVVLKAAIEYLIEDDELRERCGDILLAPAKFDRPINQATLVLEDRIRKKALPTQKMVGETLVNYAFNADFAKTVLKVSDEPDDQRGFTNILRGIVPAFRNKTHHHIINTFTREEALRVCGFIDVLLRVVDNSSKIR